jgi:dipeptidyl aminopeptidase/acylaminoacyl peptidase
LSFASRRTPLSTVLVLAPLLLFTCCAFAQEPAPPRPAPAAAATSGGAATSTAPTFSPPNYNSDVVLKRMDDLLWYQKVGDIADIDKSEYTGPPNEHIKNKKEPGATNPILLHAYTFIPKKLDRSHKQPLIVFVHQGVHASLDTTIDAHLIRELLEQGYPIVATDYRGSTGYGRTFY